MMKDNISEDAPTCPTNLTKTFELVDGDGDRVPDVVVINIKWLCATVIGLIMSYLAF